MLWVRRRGVRFFSLLFASLLFLPLAVVAPGATPTSRAAVVLRESAVPCAVSSHVTALPGVAVASRAVALSGVTVDSGVAVSPGVVVSFRASNHTTIENQFLGKTRNISSVLGVYKESEGRFSGRAVECGEAVSARGGKRDSNVVSARGGERDSNVVSARADERDGAAVFARDSRAVSGSGSERARVELAFGDISVVYYDELLPEPDHIVTEELHERRINAPFAEKLRYVDENTALGATAKAALLYTFPRLARAVNEFLTKVECEPTDGTIEFRPYASPKFRITRERRGRRVDESRLYRTILSALHNGRDVKVKVTPEYIEPSVTADTLSKCTRLRSSFTTDYSRSTENRKHNVRLALRKLAGVRIDPGKELSFNAVVGARTAARGFMTAKIISDGEYVEGTGGGVCQASTTLYNAALLSGLTVVKVCGHSLPPSYVPPSFDAMVNSGAGDLVLRNDGPLPVFVNAYGDDERATVEIYGEPLPYKIVRESRVISRGEVPPDRIIEDGEGKYIPEGAEPGTKVRISNGTAGIGSEGYLAFYDLKGRFIERKLIRRDVYRSAAGTVAVKPQEKT